MSNLKLYEIEQSYVQLANQIIDNEGEVTPELETALQLTIENLETKGRGYGFIIKDLENDIDSIDKEIARLTAFKKSRSKTVDRLKETLSDAMQLFQIEKIETPTLKISFRKSESVEVESVALLDPLYIVTKQVKTADKESIKLAIKGGLEVVGAVLKQNKNLQIK